LGHGEMTDEKIGMHLAKLEHSRKRGVKFSRPSKLTPYQRQKAMQRRDNGELLTEIARDYNIHVSNISRLRA
jgi:hypothetical protein